MAVLIRDKYEYTVSRLLHDAGRHRPTHECDADSQNCRCEEDHVLELQLVVTALNKIADGTYNGSQWQTILVDFFDKKHRNWACLPPKQYVEKARALDKWIRHRRRRPLNDNEMKWIKEIRKIWRNSNNQLEGFGEFKQAFNVVIGIDRY